MLCHGNSLHRPDICLRYRMSNNDFQTYHPVELLTPEELSCWGLSYLLEPKAGATNACQGHFLLNYDD